MRTLVRNKLGGMPLVLWAAIGVLLLLLAKVFVKDPLGILILFFVGFVFLFLLNKRVEYAITLLILFSIGVFGIYRGLSMPHITLPFGRFYISDVLLLGLAAYSFCRKFSGGIKRYGRSQILWAVSFLCGAILFEASVNLLSGLHIRSLFFGLRSVAYYMIFFIVLYEIERPEQLNRLMISLFVIALITSMVSYFQFVTGWSFLASKIERFQGLNIFRTYQWGGILMNAVFLVLVSMILSGYLRKMSVWLVALFSIFALGGAILTSFARSTWGGMLLGIIFIVIFTKKRKGMMQMAFALPFVLLFLFATNIALESRTSQGISMFIERMESGQNDLLTQSGTYLNRLELIKYKWSNMRTENLIYGRGFDWGPKGMNWNLNPYHPIVDSSIPNIFIIFGIPGFFIFGWIFFAVFMEGISLLKKMQPSFHKSIILGILAFNLQILGVCFFGDRLTWVPSVAILALSWGGLELIGRFHEKGVLSGG